MLRFCFFFDSIKGVFGVLVCVSFIFELLLFEIDCGFNEDVVVFFFGVIEGGEVGLGLGFWEIRGFDIILLKLG